MAFGDEIFTFDLLRRNVWAHVSPRTALDFAFWKTLLLPIALGLLGPSFGLVPVHAACLSGPRDVLLLGNSGAGKSTLSVALAKLGWTLVSDDWTYVDGSGESLLAHGLHVPVKLLPDARNYFPELACHREVISFNGELAFEVDPRAVFGVETALHASPSAIIVIERQESTRLDPLDGDSIRPYFRSNLERLPSQLDNFRQARDAVVEKLCAIPARVFSYRGTPAEGAAQLALLLEESFS